MSEHGDFEELALRAGASVRAEATAADAALDLPAVKRNTRKVWLASAAGLAIAAVIALFVVMNNDESPSTVQAANSTSTTPASTTPMTTVAPTTSTATIPPISPPLALNGDEPAYPGCADDGSDAAVAPRIVEPQCSGAHEIIDAITWTSWGDTEATGTGIYGLNDCSPSCAEGTFVRVTANLTLTEPRLIHGRLAFAKLLVLAPTLDSSVRQQTFDLTLGSVPVLDDVDAYRGTFNEETDPIDLRNLQARVDERKPTWANNPYAMTMQFMRIWFWDAHETYDIVETSDANAARRTFLVIVPFRGARADDSVKAGRFEVTFTGEFGDRRYETATVAFQCHAGRGHQDFSTEPCI